MPPNGSGNDMPGGGPLTPGMQGNASDSNLNAPKFSGNELINSLLLNEDIIISFKISFYKYKYAINISSN